MATSHRREFLKVAGAASAAVVLTGVRTGEALSTGQAAERFDVDAQIDPWIELDLDNLASNAAEVRRQVGDRPIMAVVKCNAYGHGAVQIATALQDRSGVRHFMVIKTREATTLRQNGITGMILNAGAFTRHEVRALLEHDISQSVFSDAVDVLDEEAGRIGTTAKVHICVDTGMGRVGVPHREALSFIERVAGLPNIAIEGVFTAMTEDDDFNPVQIQRIEEVCSAAENQGISVGVRHAASTAEVERYPYAYLDMVRPGSCLVGLEPERQQHMTIRPVMSFKTRVLYVKTMQPGESLSYHRAYPIEQVTKIATLPCGYSDGYPPVVSGMATVLIRGRRHRVVGPITANHMMVDVTESDVSIGDEVVLWGTQGTEQITKVELEEFAPQATNAYRMATRTRTYLPRITTSA